MSDSESETNYFDYENAYEEHSSTSVELDAELDGGDTTETGETSFLDILRQLLQGNASTLLHTVGAGTDSDTDSDPGSGNQLRVQFSRRYQIDEYDSDWSDNTDQVDYFIDQRSRTQQTPMQSTNPDTSVLDKSEFKQQLEYEAGCLHSHSKKIKLALSTTPGMMMMKEAGIFTRQQNMSNGQRVTALCHYLPNSVNPIVRLRRRDKFFCGIYNNDGNIFMSACQDAQIRLYDTTNGHWDKIKTIGCRDVGWSILDVDFSHCGNYIIYSSWSESVHLCNVRGDTEVHQNLFLAPGENYRTAVFSLRFNPDDTEILAGANNGYIYVFNRERNERIMKMCAHEDDLSSVVFADNSGHIMYSGGEDGLINVWDRRNLSEDNPVPVGQLSGHYDSIVHIDSKNDARYLLTNSKDQTIKLWDIRKFATQEGVEATRLAVSKQNWDYRWHSYVGRNTKNKLQGDCSLMTYYGHSVLRTLIRARFSPVYPTGQRYIYCGDGLGRVLVYDILSGEVAQILSIEGRKGHKKQVVRDVSWHPYENTIVSSGWDSKILEWQYNPDTSEANKRSSKQNRKRVSQDVY